MIKHYRKFPHILFTQFLFPGNIKTFKQRFICPDLEETTKHTHIQCFPKTPRSCKKIYFPPLIDQLFDKPGLIYIIKIRLTNFLKFSIPTGSFGLFIFRVPLPFNAKNHIQICQLPRDSCFQSSTIRSFCLLIYFDSVRQTYPLYLRSSEAFSQKSSFQKQ